jgi:hypothetical protein
VLLNVWEAVRFMMWWSLGAEAAWGRRVLSSSTAEEVLGRYDKIEDLRCIGGVGDGVLRSSNTLQLQCDANGST